MNQKNNSNQSQYTSDNNDCSDEIVETARWLTSLTPTEFTTIGSIIAIVLSNGLTYNEQNSIGNFLQMVGQIMTTFNAQVQTLQPPTPTCFDFKQLRMEIERLDRVINQMKNG